MCAAKPDYKHTVECERERSGFTASGSCLLRSFKGCVTNLKKDVSIGVADIKRDATREPSELC